MRYLRATNLTKILNLSMSVVTILISRHDFERDIMQFKSPIVCNKKNKKLLMQSISELIQRSIDRNRSYTKLQKALEIIEAMDWNNEQI